MSEYQYYEFLAVDKPLTRQQQAEVRAFSTRASISSTRFVNEYHWGDFKGDPVHLLAHYYDLMVYFANWGTRQLMVAYPAGEAELAWWRRAFQGLQEGVEITHKNGRVILDISSDSQDDYEDFDYGSEGEGSSWMAELQPLRNDFRANDPRLVCLLQLAGLSTFMPPIRHEREEEEEEDEQLEGDESDIPAKLRNLDLSIPAGMSELPPAHQALARFIRVHPSLLSTAGELNPVRLSQPSSDQLARFLSRLDPVEKDRIIASLLEDSGDTTLSDVRQRWLRSCQSDDSSAVSITCGTLIEKAYERLRLELRKRQEEKTRKEQRRLRDYEAELSRESKRKNEIWARVEAALDRKPRAAYMEAVKDLVTLHDVSIMEGSLGEFLRRFDELTRRYAKRTAFRSHLEPFDFTSPRNISR
jgi:hypothetical protein